MRENIRRMRNEGNNDYKYAYGLNLVRNPKDIVAIYFGENERIELR